MWSFILIVLTFSIPVIPIGTRRFFISKVETAMSVLTISNLDTGKGIHAGFPSVPANCEPNRLELPEDTIINTIEEGELGFRHLKETIEEHRKINADVKAFHLFWGDVVKISTSMCINLPAPSVAKTNGILCAELKDGSYQRVLFYPHDPESVADLREIHTWSKESAAIRSNRVTVTLAFVWFASAVLTGYPM